MDKIASVCEEYGTEFLRETSVAPYTTFKIGGKCNIVKVNGTAVLYRVMNRCNELGLPYHILGRGSNVLISDDGLDGVVLLISCDFGKIDVDGDTLKCQAGAKLSDVCKAAAMHSLTGLEFAYGIPGAAGGALCMNAGAYGGEMSQVVESCSYITADNREEQRMETADMDLGYRHSTFTNQERVITKVRFRLTRSDKSAIKARMDEITAARLAKQPLDFPSAGSVFKRPENHFAAKLIDDCGLKGRTIGGAKVSDKHAGFIVNTGGATFRDVTALIEFVRGEVLAQTGILLETEVKIWK